MKRRKKDIRPITTTTIIKKYSWLGDGQKVWQSNSYTQFQNRNRNRNGCH